MAEPEAPSVILAPDAPNVERRAQPRDRFHATESINGLLERWGRDLAPADLLNCLEELMRRAQVAHAATAERLRRVVQTD